MLDSFKSKKGEDWVTALFVDVAGKGYRALLTPEQAQGLESLVVDSGEYEDAHAREWETKPTINRGKLELRVIMPEVVS